MKIETDIYHEAERLKIAAVFADAQRLDGQTVSVSGWARTIRDMKNFGFIELNDGSCFKNLQVVMERETLENYAAIAAQNVGAALNVVGEVRLTPVIAAIFPTTLPE